MSTYKRQTVSEFIRETKPDWERVKTREARTSTRPFSGPMSVRMPNQYDWTVMGKPVVPESLQEQADRQMRQILKEEDLLALWGEEDIEVDDREDGPTGSQLPR